MQYLAAIVTITIIVVLMDSVAANLGFPGFINSLVGVVK